ncbi:MAG: endonuclease domain-containing protein [Planctomycetales bacterium]|nr:endonuclease domain-containing protein [Planctomycetales bacterium]
MPKRRLQRVTDLTRERATALRRQATAPERILWSALRSRSLDGLKFRRQHPIEPYIVDFYCAEVQLIVELDGESHNGREDYDRQRSEYLGRLGFRVIRVSNDDVLHNLEGAVAYILRIARQPF